MLALKCLLPSGCVPTKQHFIRRCCLSALLPLFQFPFSFPSPLWINKLEARLGWQDVQVMGDSEGGRRPRFLGLRGVCQHQWRNTRKTQREKRKQLFWWTDSRHIRKVRIVVWDFEVCDFPYKYGYSLCVLDQCYMLFTFCSGSLRNVVQGHTRKLRQGWGWNSSPGSLGRLTANAAWKPWVNDPILREYSRCCQGIIRLMMSFV